MLKKILILILFMMMGVAIFLAGFLFSRKGGNTNNVQQALLDNSLVSRFSKSDEKHAEPNGIFNLTSSEGSFPFLSSDGKEIMYYLPRNGEIRSISVNNPLSGSNLIAKIQPGAGFISWSNNKKIIARYPTNNIFYDLDSGFNKKYDPKIKNPVISPTGERIAYNYFNETTKEGELSISDPNLENYQNVLPTRFQDWQITWVDSANLGLIKPPSLDNTNYSFFVLNTKTSSLEEIINSKNDLGIAFSKDGKKMFYSYSDPFTKENSTFSMDLATKEETSLKISLNASKCIWSIDNKNIYCADKDSFISFDTSSGSGTTTIKNSKIESADSITNLVLTDTEKYLIFKNLSDGKLYALRIGQ